MVFIEDDAILCKGFAEKVEGLVRNELDVISFFERPLSPKKQEAGFFPGRMFSSTVCNYFSRRVCDELSNWENAEQFKEWYRKSGEVWTYPSDTYIAYILNKMKIKYYKQVPFFAQHETFKSTLGARSTKRQTRYFIDNAAEGNGFSTACISRNRMGETEYTK